MIIVADPSEKVEKRILEAIKDAGDTVPQRLMSERKLARLLKVPQSCVHRGIRRLVHKGVLHTKHGSGTYIKPKGLASSAAETPAAIKDAGNKPVESDLDLQAVEDLTASFIGHTLTKSTLRINVLLGNDPLQIDMWRHVFAGFEEQYPFLGIVPSFDGAGAAEADVAMMTPQPQPQRQGFHSFDRSMLVEEGFDLEAIPPDLLRLGEADESGKQLSGLPILRTSAMILVNPALLSKCGLTADLIKEPKDLFAAGDAVEQTLGGDIRGLRYLGFVYHASLYGFYPRREGNRHTFDRDLLRRFLEETKPCIKPHHLRGPTDYSRLRLLLTGHYAVYPCLSFVYSLIQRSRFHDHSQVIPIPRLPGGFVSEGVWLARVTTRCKQVEDARSLLRYLVSAEGQRRFVQRLPYWLSVRRDVLEEQKRSSPFPAGALNYDFDWRSYCGYYPFQYPKAVGLVLSTESARYFAGVQSLSKTLERIERCVGTETQIDP